MSLSCLQRKFSVSRARVLTLIAGLFLSFSYAQSAAAVSVSFAFSGVIDTKGSNSAEPILGMGDSYSGQLNFDVNSSNIVTGMSGNFVANGYAVNLTSYAGRNYTDSSGRSAFGFNTNAVGGGSGQFNFAQISFRFVQAGGSFVNLYDMMMGDAVFVNTDILLLKSVGSSTFFSNYYDNDPNGDLAVGVVPSVVPLPAALSLYAAGLAVLGLVGWRRKHNAS